MTNVYLKFNFHNKYLGDVVSGIFIARNEI